MLEKSILDSYRLEGDVRYASYDSPAGELYVLGNDSALRAVIFGTGRSTVDKHFKMGLTPPIAGARKFLDDYFNAEFEKPQKHGIKLTVLPSRGRSVLKIKYEDIEITLDMSGFTEKEIAVYRRLISVPPGSVISYGALAVRAGIPRGARFAGNAMAKNNFPIIIPCHRVIKSDGSLGHYSCGPHRKAFLLNHEHAFKNVSLK